MIGWIVLYAVAGLAFAVFAALSGNFIGRILRKVLFRDAEPSSTKEADRGSSSIIVGKRTYTNTTGFSFTIGKGEGRGSVEIVVEDPHYMINIGLPYDEACMLVRDLQNIIAQADVEPATPPEVKG